MYNAPTAIVSSFCLKEIFSFTVIDCDNETSTAHRRYMTQINCNISCKVCMLYLKLAMYMLFYGRLNVDLCYVKGICSIN